MNQVHRARLTGRAARFLQLMQDYGHLDDQAVEQVMLAITESVGSPSEPPADLPLVRRLAAITLFTTRGDELDQGDTVLDDDWPFLFS